MATIAEMAVRIGADTGEFERETSRMDQQLSNIGNEVREVASSLGTSATDMQSRWRDMSNEMRDAYRRQSEALRPFREQQREVEYGFFQMAQGMDTYRGTNQEFMGELLEMGNRQRQVNDQMIASNNHMRTSFIQGVATMLARSASSDKIADNFRRMGNPLYSVNNGLLRVTGNLERIANRGQPAALALQMLGPTASMKKLREMTMLITQGLMRFQMVALAAVVVNALMFSALHDAAKESVPGYKEAFEQMGAAVRKAFQPMVDVFGAVMKKVYEFITYIANLVIKFNESYPVLAKVIQGFLMLIPVLILLLSPLAIGIGLVHGFHAAFASIWLLIKPLILGLAAMTGTVLLVAGAIAIVGVALWALWTKTSWFKDSIINAWLLIKSMTKQAWDYILNSVVIPVMNELVSFANQMMNKLRDFWQKNGDNITKIATVVWGFVKTYIISQIMALVATLILLWNMVSSVIKSTWSNIKGIISGALDIILGIIGIFVSVFTGDWKGAWDSAKQMIQGAWKIIANLATLGVNVLLGIVRGLGKSIGGEFGKIAETFYNAGKGFMDMLVKGINSAIGKVLSTIEKVAGKVRDFLPFSPAKEGPLSDLDHLDFGGPISDSIDKAIPKVQSLMGDMLNIPTLKVSSKDKVNPTSQVVNIELNYSGNGNPEDAFAMADILEDEFHNRLSNRLRMSGVR